LPWLSGRRSETVSYARDVARSTGEVGGTPVETWGYRHPLRTYAVGLRERVCTYFEVHDMDSKKPKLVAVTGCGKGVGVSTVASGLATELSKIGSEKVLLLDMNEENSAAHSFFMGNLGYDVNQGGTPDRRAAHVHEKIYSESEHNMIDRELTTVLFKRFKYLAPKLKATQYDYIVFDMPPVSPHSSTPELAGHMDLTLLILESERTGHKAAAEARELMQKSQANVAAVLNKCRRQVLESFSQEL